MNASVSNPHHQAKIVCQGVERLGNFDRWFGASKAVGLKGAPLVLYHGTGADFDDFHLSHFGKTDGGWAGQGFYFTPDPHDASVYALHGGSAGSPNVVPVYLSVRNPLEWRLGTEESSAIQARRTSLGAQGFREWLQVEGYDGVHITSRLGEDQWMVLHPHQIKSAIGNNGCFAMDNHSITDRIASAQQAMDYLCTVESAKAVLHAG